LTSAASLLTEKCVSGITANKEKCAANVEQSLALATFLVPKIGYDEASEVAKEAHAKEKTIRQVVLQKKFMSEEEFDRFLDELRPV